MSDLIDNMKNKVEKVTDSIDNKFHEAERKYQENQFVNSIKHQLKNTMKEEGKLAKKSIDTIKESGSHIKNDIKNHFSNKSKDSNDQNNNGLH